MRDEESEEIDMTDYEDLIKKLRAYRVQTDMGSFQPVIVVKADHALEELVKERDTLLLSDMKRRSREVDAGR